MNRKEATAVLDVLKRELERNIEQHPKNSNDTIILYNISEKKLQIKAIQMGIDELQLTIDNQ